MVLDPERIRDSFGEETDVLEVSIRAFLKSYPEQLGKLRGALADGDADRVGSGAHCLKGSIGIFTLGGAYGSAHALERLGRSGRLEEAAEALAELESEGETLRRDLEQLLETLPA